MLWPTVSGFKRWNIYEIIDLSSYLILWKEYMQYYCADKYWHGEDRSHRVQWGNEDADLTDRSSQQQSPSRFSISFPMAKHLTHTCTQSRMKTEDEHMRMKNALTVLELTVCLTCKKGTMPSRAMACSRRGAPVKLCSPAPQQEKKEPITITQGEGHDNVPMTRFPFTESPNL